MKVNHPDTPIRWAFYLTNNFTVLKIDVKKKHSSDKTYDLDSAKQIINHLAQYTNNKHLDFKCWLFEEPHARRSDITLRSDVTFTYQAASQFIMYVDLLIPTNMSVRCERPLIEYNQTIVDDLLQIGINSKELIEEIIDCLYQKQISIEDLAFEVHALCSTLSNENVIVELKKRYERLALSDSWTNSLTKYKQTHSGLESLSKELIGVRCSTG